MSELYEIAKNAAKLAKEKGADDASAGTYRSRDVELEWRDGRVEKVTEATTRGLSLSLYVDGRYSAVSTSDLRPDALATFLEESIAMARTLAKDPHRALTDPKLYEGRSNADLQLSDPKYDSVSPEDRRKLAKALEEAALGANKNDAILSVTTSVTDSRWESARVTTNGFVGENTGTSFWMSAQVTAKDPDGRRPDGYQGGGARFVAELPSAAEIGKEAATRALSTIGSKKISSAVLPMVVENRVAGRVIRALQGPMAGRALQQKQSFLDGKLGKPIASKLLTIVDDPLIPKGFGSRLYDGDGIAAKKFPVIEAGVLRSYYIDVYYGRKLGVAPTTASSSNLIFTLGQKNLPALMKDVKEGIFVTAFLGGNSNATTGDYSFGVQGFKIENGEPTIPIGEMNISGNLGELFMKLSAVGNDPYPYASTKTPTLVFDGVQFAGV